jgi:hypothetical protein
MLAHGPKPQSGRRALLWGYLVVARGELPWRNEPERLGGRARCMQADQVGTAKRYLDGRVESIAWLDACRIAVDRRTKSSSRSARKT